MEKGVPAPWVQDPMCTREEDQSQFPCGFSVGLSGPRPREDRGGEDGSWDRAAQGAGKAARAESLALGEFARPAAGRQAAQPWPNG